MFFLNTLVMASTATKYHQLTAVLLIFKFMNQCKIEISICEQHLFCISLPEHHIIQILNPTAAQNWCKRPQKMLFISSTKYLNIRWVFHFVVFLVSFSTCSIPIFLLKNVFSWTARKKTAFHKQHEITSLIIYDYSVNMRNNEQREIPKIMFFHQQHKFLYHHLFLSTQKNSYSWAANLSLHIIQQHKKQTSICEHH